MHFFQIKTNLVYIFFQKYQFFLNTVLFVIMAVRKRIPESVRWHIAASQSFCCAACDTMLPDVAEIDHVLRLADGGTDDINNLIALCSTCHSVKSHMEVIESRTKYSAVGALQTSHDIKTLPQNDIVADTKPKEISRGFPKNDFEKCIFCNSLTSRFFEHKCKETAEEVADRLNKFFQKQIKFRDNQWLKRIKDSVGNNESKCQKEPLVPLTLLRKRVNELAERDTKLNKFVFK